jgi:hypothetical protein
MGGGSSIPCCTALDNESIEDDDDRETLVPPPDQHFRHHNLEIVSRTNNLLNRWSQSEVSILKVRLLILNYINSLCLCTPCDVSFFSCHCVFLIVDMHASRLCFSSIAM